MYVFLSIGANLWSNYRDKSLKYAVSVEEYCAQKIVFESGKLFSFFGVTDPWYLLLFTLVNNSQSAPKSLSVSNQPF